MVMTTVIVIALMTISWALVSASQQWNARRDVQAAAAAASRAGAQPSIDEIRDGHVELDPQLAAQRAHSVLNASGYSGSVTTDGAEVIVVAHGSVDYAFPAPGFPGSLSATGSSSSVRGVYGEEGP